MPGGAHDVQVNEAIARGGRTLTLSYDWCNPEEAVAHVEESVTTVTVRVTVKGDTKGDCVSSLDVGLDAPLGTREVIDDSTGKQVPRAGDS